MIELRPYQTQAVNDLAQGLTKHKNVVGWLPTASGKSVIIAAVCQRILDKHPGHRVLVLCHTAEILTQNNNKCRQMGLDSGIYCAGLKRKDTNNRVIHASRDSLKGNECGFFDFVIVDECHLVSESEKTRYQLIFCQVKPRYIIGLTGTPWRIKGGRIFGKGKFWDACVASISMQTLFDQGYLCPYVVPPALDVIKADSLKISGGDFNLKLLDEKSTPDEVIKSCLDQWEYHAHGRKFTLVFCCSIAHALKIHTELLKRGFRGTYLTEKTNAMDRKRILAEVNEGAHEYLCNVAVLTTGVDIPIVDCVLFLRATQSLSLWVQMIGRGLRLAPDKENAMMLDCAGNFERLGRPENPKERTERSAANEPTTWTKDELLAMGIDPAMMVGSAGEKTCPNCRAEMPMATKKCRQCGHLFISHSHRIFHGEIKPGLMTVDDVTFKNVTKKDGKCVWIVEYYVPLGVITEFLSVEEHIPEFAKAQNRSKINSLVKGVVPSQAFFSTNAKNFWRSEWKETRRLSSLLGLELSEFFAGETTQEACTIPKLANSDL